MKKIINKFILLAILTIPNICSAQQINWRNFKDNKTHIVNINTGWDYGLVAGIGYGHKLKIKLPIVLNIEYSSPFGEKVFDDIKTKLGGQAEVIKANSFSVSIKAYSIFRRYENEFARLVNFGSEFSTNFGYYKLKWYIAGEFGFDKAITTHIKNSKEMKSIYPNIQDGWYVPTGGNFFYGIISGYTFKSIDVYIKAGKSVTQDFKVTPTIPVYLQLSFNRRF
ncbi:MAG: hypothetical protein Q8L07_02115 [Sediminibacterium sp.]|nr:hypothetical protein [Sediminibacterium sp.]